MTERRYIWGIFYFNKADKRVIVPKINQSLGWTINFARWEAYLIILIIVAAAILATKFG